MRKNFLSRYWPWLLGGVAIGAAVIFEKSASAANAAPDVILAPGVQTLTTTKSNIIVAPPPGATWAASSDALIYGGGMSNVATPQGGSSPVSIPVSSGLNVFVARWIPAGGAVVETAVLIGSGGVVTTGVVTDPALVASAQAMLATESAKRQIPNLNYSGGAVGFPTALAIFQQYVNAQNSGVTLITTGNLDYPTFAVLTAAAAGI